MLKVQVVHQHVNICRHSKPNETICEVFIALPLRPKLPIKRRQRQTLDCFEPNGHGGRGTPGHIQRSLKTSYRKLNHCRVRKWATDNKRFMFEWVCVFVSAISFKHDMWHVIRGGVFIILETRRLGHIQHSASRAEAETSQWCLQTEESTVSCFLPAVIFWFLIL